MIRSVVRACAAALGLRRAPTSGSTPEPVPTVDSVYSDRPFLSGEDLAKAEQEEARQEGRAEILLGPLGRRTAEVVTEQALWPGMPETWPCRCGGRPFVNSLCPRCGRTEGEGRAR